MTLNHYLDVKSIRTPKWCDAKSERFVFGYDASGVSQIWEYDLKLFQLSQVSDYDNFIVGIATSPNTQRVAFSMSDSGNERFQIFLKNEKGWDNITNNPDASHFLGSFSDDGKYLFYTSNARDFAHFDLYLYNIETQEKSCLKENNDNYNFPETMSPNGNFLAYRKLISEDDQPLWIYDRSANNAYPIHEAKAKYLHPLWKNNDAMYIITNKDSEFNHIAEYSLKDNELKTLISSNWDIETMDLSACGRYLAYVLNEDGYSKLRVYDLNLGIHLNSPQPPKGEIAYYDTISFSPTGLKLLFTLSSGTRAPNVWEYDIEKESVRRITENYLHEDIINACVDAKLMHFKSFDGLDVPYWLYTPKGKEPINCPVMIEIHGGPEGQEKASFNELIQIVVGQGISVVAPNVRGSTGYGKTYTHLDDVEKRLDSVKDIESLVDHLVKEKIADPKKVAVSGTSYGGFMTLSCASRYPDLFCGAIDNVGMYNLVTFLENTASYRRAHRESEYGSLANDRDMLFEVSPVSRVDDVKGPLMVIHGANDPRVPVSEAEQVVTYLKDKGVPVTYLRYEDEGHGLHKIENKLDCYQNMIAFLKECMKLT